MICLIVLGVSSCSENDIDHPSVTNDPSVTTLNGTWKMVSLEDYVANTVEFKTQENSWGLDITITFDDTKNPHEFSGNNTTNIFHGQFEYIQAREFRTLDFATTEVAQPSWADAFMNAMIDDGSHFSINNSKLRIFYANDKNSVTLLKQ